MAKLTIEEAAYIRLIMEQAINKVIVYFEKVVDKAYWDGFADGQWETEERLKEGG